MAQRNGGALEVSSLAFLIASLAVILFAATLFVNAVEWLGIRLSLSQGATGSVLAAVGTALPESLIPAVAILFGRDGFRHEVGIGAILGAPLMLATLAMALTGLSLFFYSRGGGRSGFISADYGHIQQQLTFFLWVYSLAIILALLPLGDLRYAAAIGFVFAYMVFVRSVVRSGLKVEAHGIGPLRFAPRQKEPALWLIASQLIVSLALLLGGAHLFVEAVSDISHALGISALVLSLIIAPIATELPEKFNSIIWIGQRKDTLALGNITGAMAFQSTIPVAIGIAFTPWRFETVALVAAILALLAAALLWLVFARRRRKVGATALVTAGLPYLGFVAYIVVLA